MKLILSQREAQQAILRHVQTMSPSQEWRLLNEYMICGDLEFGDEAEATRRPVERVAYVVSASDELPETASPTVVAQPTLADDEQPF